jgi:S-DNA-T family DNA segregation ATPase FtsK/SpoIIIE
MNKQNEFSRQPRFLPEIPCGEIEVQSPPSMADKPEISWAAMLLPPGVMLIITVIISLSSKSSYMLLSIATTVMTLIVSVSAATNQIKKYRKNKKNREKKYLQYIADTRAELAIASEKQIKALNEMHPDPKVCLQRIKNTDCKLWEKTPSYNDFLSLRIGVGSVASSIKVKYSKQQMQMDNDPLENEPEKIGMEFNKVNNVPVCLNLISSEICGIAGSAERTTDILRLAVLQIITHHGYDDVKLVFLLKEEDLENWKFIKNVQHVWNDDFTTRYIACGKTMAHETLNSLYEIFKLREMNASKGWQGDTKYTHYVFIIQDATLLENEAIAKYLYNCNKDIGVSSIFTAESQSYLPMNCKTVITCQNKNAEYANKETGEKSTIIVDSIDISELEREVRKLCPIRIKSSTANFSLPKSITLLQMLDVDRIEKVDILSKWHKNRTYKGLSVPIGARMGGELFYLDMHAFETSHGPHGLVAGTTGSGKSELLQSIIISLAINFHPHDLCFVLIDYKGGGMADVFKGMPHLVGTITNLGGNQTTRALLSIKSELLRRQRIFSEFEVNNIDKYQKLYHNGVAKEPVPHLVMIADEFAELKAEQPDFMKELVSTARVGRSLGVHLILATQKPAGVVDDQIWSNSRFKICLKVQDEADSKDVIKRPDAARIKEPGRAYIQVGNDEIFELFQSTWSGADYDPDGILKSDKNIKKKLYKVSLNGKSTQIYPLEEEKIASVDLISQLKAMVEYIAAQAKKSSIAPLNGPWLPPLQDILYLDDIYKEGSGFNYQSGVWEQEGVGLKPLVGVLDNPRAQTQEPLAIDYMKDGHLIIYGAAATGKTYLLQTIIMSLAHKYSTNNVNIYIMDFGGTALKKFDRLPHCGGVMTIEQETKIEQFMLYIFRVMEERKQLFERHRSENFNDFKEKNKSEVLPAIIIIIDNYFALSETYDSVDERMMLIAREGTKYGIYLTVTLSNATLVRYKFSVNFKMAIAFQLTEKGEYNDIVGRTEGLEPAPIPGRALVRNKPPVELQVSLPEFKNKNTEDIINIFENYMHSAKVKKAQLIPEMPARIDINEVNINADKLVIGLNNNDLQPVCLDIFSTPTIMVTGEPVSGKSTLVVSWIEILHKKLGTEKLKVYALDSNSMGIYQLLKLPSVIDITGIQDMSEFVEGITAEIELRREQMKEVKKVNGDLEELKDSWQQIVFLIDNLSELTNSDNYSFKELLERIVKQERNLKIAIIALDNTSGIEGNWDSLAKAIKEEQVGVLLGRIKEQSVFNVKIPYGTQERELEIGDGYFITKNKFIGMRSAIFYN